MTEVIDPSLADRARAALERHDWRTAYDLLIEADRSGALTAEELELLAAASWWVGRLPEAIAARERAYAGFIKAGDTLLAAVAAIVLGRDNLMRTNRAVARAWLSRAEHLLDPLPEGPGHGWLSAVRAMEDGLVGDFDAALEHASRALAIADRYAVADLQAIAMSSKGMAMINRGEVEAGLVLIDEATVPAVAGEIEPMAAGAVSCTTISACMALGDWQRAGQWIEAQDRWCQREQINGFPGMCRIYRAETKRIRGAWTEAETEARRASDELQGFVPAAIGVALYEIGLIRLRRGDLPAAEEALLEAHGRGRDPEPALSLLRLAQGRVAEAAASIRRTLEDPLEETAWGVPTKSNLRRMEVLPAQVEIALATGDVATARHAADELTGLAERYASTGARATTASVDGVVRLAEGDAAGAVAALRRSIALWSEIDAPWDSARARLALAEAYAAEGIADAAVLEANAARSAFERLGARPDLARAEALLAQLEGGTASTADAGPTEDAGRDRGRATRRGAARVTRTFAFTDIVDSTKLAELLGDEAWERLIAWHDAAIRQLVAEHDGEEVKATGDGFFLAFKEPDAAIRCAIAIQRRFAEQRRTQGFAPGIRIGLHRAEARQAGLDYIGGGVNQAARIGGVGGAGEIVASAATVAAARGPYDELGHRTVELKGVAAPIEVVTLEWR